MVRTTPPKGKSKQVKGHLLASGSKSAALPNPPPRTPSQPPRFMGAGEAQLAQSMLPASPAPNIPVKALPNPNVRVPRPHRIRARITPKKGGTSLKY
jgi:hypothetical protein